MTAVSCRCVPHVQGSGSGVLKADVRCRSKHLGSQPVGAIPPTPMKMVACGGGCLRKGLDWKSLGSSFRRTICGQKALKSPLSCAAPPPPPQALPLPCPPPSCQRTAVLAPACRWQVAALLGRSPSPLVPGFPFLAAHLFT